MLYHISVLWLLSSCYQLFLGSRPISFAFSWYFSHFWDLFNFITLIICTNLYNYNLCTLFHPLVYCIFTLVLNLCYYFWVWCKNKFWIWIWIWILNSLFSNVIGLHLKTWDNRLFLDKAFFRNLKTSWFGLLIHLIEISWENDNMIRQVIHAISSVSNPR